MYLSLMEPNIAIKTIGGYRFVRYEPLTFSEPDMHARAASFFELMNRRRSVREFSNRPVPRDIVEQIVRTASTAPSGAHKQPWTFCLVQDPMIKKKIREAAEQEEYENYHHRMSDEWLKDLQPLQTDWRKPFLETAPWLIVVFKKLYDPRPDGTKGNHYYVSESVGLACGILLTAIHHAGLVALTHTPSPMGFLGKVLNRPAHERPFLLIPVGYPAEEVYVPDLKRKSLSEVAVFY